MKINNPVRRDVTFTVASCPSCHVDIIGTARVDVEVGVGPIAFNRVAGVGEVRVTGDPKISHVIVNHECVHAAPSPEVA